MVRERELKLLQYLNEHIGEQVTARKIYEDLRKQYGHNSGFSSPRALARVLIRYKKPVGKVRKTNIYLI